MPSPKRSPAPKWTAAQSKRVQGHIRARGLTFEVFLPESLADWLCLQVQAGHFASPREAAFVAFQELQALSEHPQARALLLELRLKASLEDPRPSVPMETVIEEMRQETHRMANTRPPRARALPKSPHSVKSAPRRLKRS